MTLIRHPPGQTSCPAHAKPGARPSTPSGIPLDHLPYHLLKLIASYSDERSLWRLSATSRALREAAQIPLRHFLASKSITSKPPHVSDIFEPIYIVTEKDSVRYTSLERTSRLFQTHLAHFPPSLHLLRHLTVEVRADDYHLGWRQIRRFAHTLESLTLHFLDPVGLIPEHGDDEYDPYEEEGTMAFLWPELVDSPLTNLTTLTIATNVRILHHFGGIASSVPKLRHLTLSCYGPDEFEYTVFDAPEIDIRLDTLETLTLAGFTSTVIFSVYRILPLARNLTTLTIRVPPNSRMPTSSQPELRWVVRTISKRQQLTVLGLYGGAGDIFLESMASLQSTDPGRFNYQYITSIVLERLEDGASGQGQGNYPLLDSGSKPDFPSLQHLTYFDRQTDDFGQFTLGSHDRLGFHDFYHSAPLHKLFSHYPQLRQVLWIAGYPDSLLDKDAPKHEWAEHNIRCRVRRRLPDVDISLTNSDLSGGSAEGIKLRAQRASWREASRKG